MLWTRSLSKNAVQADTGRNLETSTILRSRSSCPMIEPNMRRVHLYISHRFAHADLYMRILEFIAQEGFSSADFSVPAWKRIPGDREDVYAGIAERVRMSSHVIVLLSPAIHDSHYIRHELEMAKKYNKPIIGIYPHGHNEGPIPQMLDGHIYRAIGWRSGSLRKALNGEYPLERRVFDIAEIRQRVELVQKITTAVSAVTVLVAGFTAYHYVTLRNQLRRRGIELVEPSSFLRTTAMPTVIGAAVGAILPTLFGGNTRDMAIGAAIGAAAGMAIGATRHFRLQIVQIGELQQLTFVPAETSK